MIGLLTLTPLNARLERDTQMVGRMAPYVKCTVNNKSQSTKPASGKNPVWNNEKP